MLKSVPYTPDVFYKSAGISREKCPDTTSFLVELVRPPRGERLHNVKYLPETENIKSIERAMLIERIEK